MPHRRLISGWFSGRMTFVERAGNPRLPAWGVLPASRSSMMRSNLSSVRFSLEVVVEPAWPGAPVQAPMHSTSLEGEEKTPVVSSFPCAQSPAASSRGPEASFPPFSMHATFVANLIHGGLPHGLPVQHRVIRQRLFDLQRCFSFQPPAKLRDHLIAGDRNRTRPARNISMGINALRLTG